MIKFDIKAYQERTKQKYGKMNTDDVEYVGANGNAFREWGSEDNFVQYETETHGVFTFYREFYISGDLKTSCKMAKYGHDTIIGKFETYDEKGNVTKSEDHDKGYKINYEQVLGICKKRNVNLEDTNMAYDISRADTFDSKEAPMWYVTWRTGTGPKPNSKVGTIAYRAGFQIDGVTGKITDIPDNNPYRKK